MITIIFIIIISVIIIIIIFIGGLDMTSALFLMLSLPVFFYFISLVY